MRRAVLGAWLVLAAAACSACEDSSPPPRRPAPYPYGPPPPAYGPAPQAPADQGPPTGPPLSGEQIAPVINASYPTFTACYTHSESYMTGKSGTATIFFDVARAGNVVSASDRAPPGAMIPAGALGDAKLDECLSNAMRGLRFPAAGDSTSASWTFKFSP